MPPQQSDRLLDLLDEAFRFGTHCLFLAPHQFKKMMTMF
jgi:hypothetical protein